MRCAFYVRASTNEQAKHGYSLLLRLKKLEAFCRALLSMTLSIKFDTVLCSYTILYIKGDSIT